jgi:HK97 family phage prohead protease
LEKGWFCSDLIIKSSKPSNTVIAGYASVFGVVDSQNDIIVKGAFSDAISRDVRLLWQHEAIQPIGVVTFLEEDDYGLKFEAEINNKIIVGREASELIKQKAICGVSIGFSINSSDYDNEGRRVFDGLTERSENLGSLLPSWIAHMGEAHEVI